MIKALWLKLKDFHRTSNPASADYDRLHPFLRRSYELGYQAGDRGEDRSGAPAHDSEQRTAWLQGYNAGGLSMQTY
jgi:ribosome modulation factor